MQSCFDRVVGILFVTLAFLVARPTLALGQEVAGPFACGLPVLLACATGAAAGLFWVCHVGRRERIVQWGILGLVVLAASSGYAQDLNQIRAPVETVRTFLTGPFATTMAGIAVAGVGYLYWIGRIDKDVAVSVVVGIGIVFGSPQIVQVLSAAASR